MPEKALIRSLRSGLVTLIQIFKHDRTHGEKCAWSCWKARFSLAWSNDVTPYPIVWDDRERQTLFAGYVLATAKAMGIDLRWGGDWNRDTEVRDNSFDDLVHFEIVGE